MLNMLIEFLPFEDNSIIKVFTLLPDKVRRIFYEKHRKEVNTLRRLQNLLGVLPPDERLSCLKKYEHLFNASTENTYDIKLALVSIIRLLPNSAKLDFAIQHQPLIQITRDFTP